MGVEPAFVDVLEEGGETVEVARGDRVVFVVVAAAAFEGEAEEGGAVGGDAVVDVFDAEFFFDAAAFVGLAVETVEGGGDALVAGGVIEEIAGDLPCDELVVGEIVIEGADDPVAPWPDIAVAVGLVAEGIGVACDVAPVGGHAFAVGWGGEEMVDGGGEGGGGGIGGVGGAGCVGGREAGEGEGGAAEETFWWGGGAEGAAGFEELGGDEGVDEVAAVGGGRCGRGFDGEEGPVVLPCGTGGDPAAEDFAFVGGEGEVGVWGRHDFVRVGGIDAGDEGAEGWVAGFDDLPVWAGVGGWAEGVGAGVEAEFGFAVSVVGSVAEEAAVAEDGFDVEVEVDDVRDGGVCGGVEGEEEAEGPGHGAITGMRRVPFRGMAVVDRRWKCGDGEGSIEPRDCTHGIP